MYINFILDFLIIGLIGGLIGELYNFCLTIEGMIFSSFYEKVLTPMHEKKSFKGISKMLGYCIYCNTFWITALLLLLFMTTWEDLPQWQNVIIGICASEGMQYIIILIINKYLINNHPDFNN